MLKVGMELILESDQHDEKYKAKIEDFTDNKVYISYPIGIESNKTIYLSSNSKLMASFVPPESTGAYLFRTIIIERIKNRIPMLVLSYPGEEKLMKIQRRQFVRIEASLDVAIRLHDSEQQFTTITDDISAGGCAVLLNEHLTLSKNEIGSIYIVLPMQSKDYIYLNFAFRVVRTFEKNNLSLASLQFLNVTNHEQQQLMRYCFEKQLEYRKRGIPIE